MEPLKILIFISILVFGTLSIIAIIIGQRWYAHKRKPVLPEANGLPIVFNRLQMCLCAVGESVYSTSIQTLLQHITQPIVAEQPQVFSVWLSDLHDVFDRQWRKAIQDRALDSDKYLLAIRILDQLEYFYYTDLAHPDEAVVSREELLNLFKTLV